MRLVIDANILFSALIKNGMTAKLIFEKEFEFFAPPFMMKEFLKYERLILRKTNRTKNEFIEVYNALEGIIRIVRSVEPFRGSAKRISPDPNDAMYFALALELRCPIWSNDKRLKQQKHIRIYSTHELWQKFTIPERTRLLRTLRSSE